VDSLIYSPYRPESKINEETTNSTEEHSIHMGMDN